MDAVETFDPLRSRPNTPVKVVWYDFLLDDGLLERHLSQENPDPPALHLAAEFVYQYQVGKTGLRCRRRPDICKYIFQDLFMRHCPDIKLIPFNLTPHKP